MNAFVLHHNLTLTLTLNPPCLNEGIKSKIRIKIKRGGIA
jgi:hypothetical protein